LLNATFIVNVNLREGPLVDYRGDKDADGQSDATAATEFAVGCRVRVYPGTSDERPGIIVDDFGEDAGYRVDVGSQHIADASRRWAITLDDGGLVFVDSSELRSDEGRGPAGTAATAQRG
jgi:hypothetical protein